jgi:hypothetical protein
MGIRVRLVFKDDKKPCLLDISLILRKLMESRERISSILSPFAVI